MKKPTANRSKFVRLMKLPIRALSIARDYYVRRMVDCAQIARCPGAHGVGGDVGLHRSFSVPSSISDFGTNRNEDFKELVRVASVRTLAASGGNTNAYGKGEVRVLRCKRVGIGMGRIHEEEDDEDEEEETRKLRIDGGGGSFGGGDGRKQSVVFWKSNELWFSEKRYCVLSKRRRVIK